MAALTNVRDTSELGGKYIALPVKGATTIYQGSIVAVDATGYAIPGKKATGLKVSPSRWASATPRRRLALALNSY